MVEGRYRSRTYGEFMSRLLEEGISYIIRRESLQKRTAQDADHCCMEF